MDAGSKAPQRPTAQGGIGGRHLCFGAFLREILMTSNHISPLIIPGLSPISSQPFHHWEPRRGRFRFYITEQHFMG